MLSFLFCLFLLWLLFDFRQLDCFCFVGLMGIFVTCLRCSLLQQEHIGRPSVIMKKFEESSRSLTSVTSFIESLSLSIVLPDQFACSKTETSQKL